MVAYVLDSSAVLRFLHNEKGADRVAQIFKEHLAGVCGAMATAPHWGEIAGIISKPYGRREMEQVLLRLSAFGLEVVVADRDCAVRAALIKVESGLPYVDSFGVELATREPNRVLVTANFDFKPLSRNVKIEFLPAK